MSATATTTTPEELCWEWKYRYEERLALLAGDQEPTERQIQIAKIEADAAIKKLKSASN